MITLSEVHTVTIPDITIVILTKSLSFLTFMIGGDVYLYYPKIYQYPVGPRRAESVIKVFIPKCC